ncbi:hypothetical protein LINPERHAP2_LOCUS219 [Linum perenne]
MWPAGRFQSAMPLFVSSALQLGMLRFVIVLHWRPVHINITPNPCPWMTVFTDNPLRVDSGWGFTILVFAHILSRRGSCSPRLSTVDLQDARERTELSLLARIHWDESRDLRLVENSFILVWKCGRVRIFDVGYGLYQIIFPSSKRNFVLANQPWYFQKAIINFTDNMSPSEELYYALRFMSIWVKIISMPLACCDVAVGRKLLEPMGEVVRMGYFDAKKPEGCYVKGRVRMDLYSSFLGTASVNGEDGTSFKVFFQYEGVPCICYLCGFLGHAMGDCSHTELDFDPLVRDSWICGVPDPDEVVVPSQDLLIEDGRRNGPGLELTSSMVKQAETLAGPCDKLKFLGPRPSVAASSLLGSGPFQALQGGAFLGAESTIGACQMPSMVPSAGQPFRPSPVEASLSSESIKRKLQPEFEEGEAAQSLFPPSPRGAGLYESG